MENRIKSSEEIIGPGVVSKTGENLGRVHSLVLDLKTETILYAVLYFGGRQWQTQDRYFAVPLKALQFDGTPDKRIVLDMNIEKLKDAPGFDRDNWSFKPTEEFNDSVFKHYG